LNGKQHGEGLFITPAGAQRKGIWHEGKRIKWNDEDNDEYEENEKENNDAYRDED
jgi:hypothetical protein